MAKNKISEYSSIAANNTDISGINIAEGCAPSGINNAIRELMAQLKDQQSGTDSDNFAVGGNLTIAGTSAFTGVATFTAAPIVPTTFGIVPSGGIIMWSGSIASIPSGWLLCDGTSGTPNLRDKFIVGAGSTYAVAAAGGSADAITVAHTHAGVSESNGNHQHFVANNDTISPGSDLSASNYLAWFRNGGPAGQVNYEYRAGGSSDIPTLGLTNSAGSHTHTLTIESTGASGTNANLPPYYALAYIMKS